MSDTGRSPLPPGPAAGSAGRAKALAAAAFRAEASEQVDHSEATSVAARIIAAQMRQSPASGGAAAGGRAPASSAPNSAPAGTAPVDAQPLQRAIVTRNAGQVQPAPASPSLPAPRAAATGPKGKAVVKAGNRAVPTSPPPAAKLPNRGPRVRLLPMVIFVAVVMLGARLSEMTRLVQDQGGLMGLVQLPVGTPAEAQSNTTQKPNAAAPTGTTPDAGVLPPAMQENLRRQQDAAEGPEDRIGVFVGAPEEFQRRLSERRAELDKRERALNEKSALIAAAEQRLDEKITELQGIKAQIEQAMAAQAQAKANEQTADISRLVAIYEGMKPAQAAAIFNELELPVLVSVTERMKEKSLSEVLARMAPAKAMELTTSLAVRKKTGAAATATN
jgi:flagellar motility protein MotE (MotC chaperone)